MAYLLLLCKKKRKIKGSRVSFPLQSFETVTLSKGGSALLSLIPKKRERKKKKQLCSKTQKAHLHWSWLLLDLTNSRSPWVDFLLHVPHYRLTLLWRAWNSWRTHTSEALIADFKSLNRRALIHKHPVTFMMSLKMCVYTQRGLKAECCSWNPNSIMTFMLYVSCSC